MTITTHIDTASLSDQDLLWKVASLAAEARATTVELIVHLAEMDRRKLHRGLGYRSLFEYCLKVLRLSEHAAFNRIEAARLGRLLPGVLDRLADGSINLTTLRLLAPHLREKNHLEVLAAAAGLKKKEVEVLIAGLAPKPDVADSIRKVGVVASALHAVEAGMSSEATDESASARGGDSHAESAQAGQEQSLEVSHGEEVSRNAVADEGPSPEASFPSPPTVPVPAPLPPGSVSPLSPQRYRVQFTIDQATFDKLRRLQDLVGGEGADGGLAAVFDRGLTLQLAESAKKKWAATSAPRTAAAGATTANVEGTTARSAPVMVKRSRHVPAAVKRAVWSRDEARCAFLSRDGRRCSATRHLEFHHIEPYAIGGEMTDGNISLRCRAHNAYEGELVFGPEKMTPRNSFQNEFPQGDRGRGGDGRVTGEVTESREVTGSDGW